MMEELIEGRIVHYVMPNGEHRPAIVVKVWRITEAFGMARTTGNGMVNLTVFVDGKNDVVPSAEVNFSPRYNEATLMRCTSVLYSPDPAPFTWHWIEPA